MSDQVGNPDRFSQAKAHTSCYISFLNLYEKLKDLGDSIFIFKDFRQMVFIIASQDILNFKDR